jgi:acetolactate synthase regulatory subunit
MKFTIEIRMRNSEGALERILGRLRQRSFALCGIVAGISPDETCIEARITFTSTRATEPVIRQIAKLYDVHHVALHAEPVMHGLRFGSGHAVSEAYVNA